MKKEFFRQCYLKKKDEQFKTDLDTIYEMEINQNSGALKEYGDSIDTIIESFAKFNAELSWNMFCLNSKDCFTDVQLIEFLESSMSKN